MLENVTVFDFFKGGNGGRIINIASMAGLKTGFSKIEHAGYTAAKHGVVALTRYHPKN